MKKIIALAVASAFVAPAVMAEVTIYGGLRTSIEYNNISSTSLDQNKVRLVDQSSRIGFKGTDKLDNGLTAFWQAEQRVRVGTNKSDGTSDVTSTGWGERNTWVGLKGGFGEVKAGKFDDIIDGSRGDFYGALGGLEETSNNSSKTVRRGSGKSQNTISYESPKMAGLVFQAQGVMGNDTTAGNANGYATTLYYSHSMFQIGAGWKQMNDISSKDINASTVTPGADYKYMVIGGSFMPTKDLKISAAWDRTNSKSSATAKNEKQDGYGIGAQYSMGKYKFGLTAGQLFDSKTGGVKNADTGLWQVSAGFNYALSKQTKLTAGLGYLENDANSSASMNNNSFGSVAGAKLFSGSVGIHTNF